MNFEALRNLIHREVLRVLDRRTRPMPCIVDAYDPNTFTVKVRLQPTDTLTGWIQIRQEATGDNFGAQIAPNIGDPGWLEFHEDDPRAAVFAGTVSNQKFPAMVIRAGEMMWKAKWGQSIYLKEDGSLALADGAGASIVLKSGTVTITDKNGSVINLDGAGIAKTTAATIVEDGPVQFNGTVSGLDGTGTVSSDVTWETTGDFIADGKSLKAHVHGGVQTGGGDTGPPV